ncbi:MAG: hypothetical protein IT180_06070 [Acidobacteria bacterium]|nr:hypothetical protein [Acidobacteriota bacterium]
MYFSDAFGIAPEVLDDYGALDVSLINDLPLFIDPFLLFNSAEPAYQALHEDVIRYLRFLRDKAATEVLSDGHLEAWFTFREVKQNWLGYSLNGNQGSGLGLDFARALKASLSSLLRSFGTETITRSSHLEKLCLISDGVGRDNISDFTTNLIKSFLLTYTETFARDRLLGHQRRTIAVPKVEFNYVTETWQSRRYELPFIANDYVLLTPLDLLTKEDVWINREDLTRDYPLVVATIPNEQLRAQLNTYLAKSLAAIQERDDKRKAPARRASKRRTTRRRATDGQPSAKQVAEAVGEVIRSWPEVVDYYIRYKEDRGDDAKALADERVRESERLYIAQVRELVETLRQHTQFYGSSGTTHSEARERVAFLKDVIENKGGWRLFFVGDEPLRRESDLHILFRLTWCNTPSDVNREVNNGRGPSDFEVSRGRFDKSIVEFKLAKSKSLARNLVNQAEAYQRASDAQYATKVIVFFTAEEESRARRILSDVGLSDHPDVVLIDARADNKTSASRIERCDDLV